jgi:hypothetical protein
MSDFGLQLFIQTGGRNTLRLLVRSFFIEYSLGSWITLKLFPSNSTGGLRSVTRR